MIMKTPKNLSDMVDDTAHQLHYSALRLVRLLRTDRAKKNNLSWSGLAVLGRLNQKGEATATELAALFRVQPQSLTRLIAELERDRLITRQPNEADRRQNLLKITEAGARILIEDIGHQRDLLAKTIAEVLTPTELELLRLAAGLIDRLAEAIEAQTADR